MPLGKPANYMLDLPDPTQAISQNLQLAMGVQKMQQEQQFNQSRIAENNARTQEILQKTAQADALDQRKLQFHAATAAAPATPEGMLKVMQMFPDMVKENKELFDSMEKTKREATINQLSQIDSALRSGNADAVRKTLTTFIGANETAGDTGQAQKYKGLLELFNTQGRDVTYKALVPYTAAALGPENYAKAVETFSTLPSKVKEGEATANLAVDKAPGGKLYRASLTAEQELGRQRGAEANKAQQAADEAKSLEGINRATKLAQMGTAQSEEVIKGNEMNMSQDMLTAKLRKEQALTAEAEAREKELLRKAGDLPGNVYKDVKDATTAAGKARENVNMLSDVRARVAKIPISGAGAKAAEWLKAAFGQEGEVTRARKDFDRIFNAQTLDQLRGLGKMTDTEFRVIDAGRPSSTASVENMTKALDMRIAMERATEKIGNFKAEWLTEFRNSASAPRDAVIAGIPVKKGDQLSSISGSMLPDLTKIGAEPPAAAAPAATPVASASASTDQYGHSAMSK